MEKANSTARVQAARFVSVHPQILKDIATRMEFESQEANKVKKKVMFQLTDDIVLYHDPDENGASAEVLRSRMMSQPTDDGSEQFELLNENKHVSSLVRSI